MRGTQTRFQSAKDGPCLSIGNSCLAGKEKRFCYWHSEKFWQVQAINWNVAICAANMRVVSPIPIVAGDELLAQ